MKTKTVTPESITPLTDAFTARMREKFFPHALGNSAYLEAVEHSKQLEQKLRAAQDKISSLKVTIAGYNPNDKAL